MEPQYTHFHSSAMSSRVSSHNLNAKPTLQPRTKPTKLPSEPLEIISYSGSTAEDRSKTVAQHITAVEAHRSAKDVVSNASASRPLQEVVIGMRQHQQAFSQQRSAKDSKGVSE